MDRPSFSNSMLSRLLSVFKGADTNAKTFTPKQIAQRVKLPFTGLDKPELTICWKDNLYLQHLHDLPRSALSGPVQEDKAEAHALLAKLVNKVVDTEPVIDLREVYGISEQLPGAAGLQNLEALAASQQCRHIRIISYRDFEKTITQAIPHFLAEQPIKLRQASWLGDQLFWAQEQNSCEFACAVVYARRRGLDLRRKTCISRYTLNLDTVLAVQKNYHMLIMPESAWSDREFMAILLASGSPYARLTLSKAPHPVEVLLLPKHKQQSNTLGEGLKLAGAHDACAVLLLLAQH